MLVHLISGGNVGFKAKFGLLSVFAKEQNRICCVLSERLSVQFYTSLHRTPMKSQLIFLPEILDLLALNTHKDYLSKWILNFSPQIFKVML